MNRNRHVIVLFVALIAVFAVIGVFAVVPSHAESAMEQDAQAKGVLVAITGRTSDITQPRYVLASGQDVFDQYWTEHMGERVECAAQGWPMTPQLDFEHCESVFVFGGQRTNHNGYHIMDVIEEDDAVTIRFDAITYQTASMDGVDHGDDATPWAMFVIPATDKTIYLEEDVQGLIGGDPKWKQRAVFPGVIGVGRTVGGTGQR